MSNTVSPQSATGSNFEWRLSLFVVIGVPLLVALGFWQLQRAEEKRIILAQWESSRRQPPVELASIDEPSPALAWRPVRLRGQFLQGRDFLLDNRMRGGRYGVEVISPLRTSSDEVVLVNRGWLAADAGRRSLPAVPALQGSVSLEGYIHVPAGESYLLGDIASGAEWPRLVQAVDVSVLGDMLGEAPFPYVVRLTPDSAGALLADWPLINTRPEKHTAYAVQWFLMALALLLLFVWRSSSTARRLRPRRQEQRNER